MKFHLAAFAAVFAIGASANAEPQVITVIGSIQKAGEAECPLRAFGYWVGGDYRKPGGAIANFGSCMGSVAIPLPEYLHQPVTPSDSQSSAALNRVVDAEKLLEKNTGRLLKMRFLVDDPETLKGGLGTLLSIEEVKSK